MHLSKSNRITLPSGISTLSQPSAVWLQGAKDVQNQPSVGFSGSAKGLQINVGLPSPGGVADKVRQATKL
jgi:hypothetical protein